MRLIKREPEESTKKVENVFKGIHEVPRWRFWLDMLAYFAAFVSLVELALRIIFWA